VTEVAGELILVAAVTSRNGPRAHPGFTYARGRLSANTDKTDAFVGPGARVFLAFTFPIAECLIHLDFPSRPLVLQSFANCTAIYFMDARTLQYGQSSFHCIVFIFLFFLFLSFPFARRIRGTF
jgi:hypothetical protein